MKKKFLFGTFAVMLIVFGTAFAFASARGPPITPPGLQKVVFIHYKKGFVKPGTECGNGICEPGENARKCPADCGDNGDEESTCYTFLSRGLKWKDLPVDYVIDPDNNDGLTQGFITGAITASASEWDAHTSAGLFGEYTIDHNATWDDETPDGRNELLFGDYSQPGVIAVAIVWGHFIGPPSTRQIVEFDILCDTDFTWGDATVDPTVMDLQNIATHEIGHGLGLGDLYETVCIDETMYGYSREGETSKRDLNTGDIIGIQELYGA